MNLSQYIGDSKTYELPLTWEGDAVTLDNDEILIFTAKQSALDPDDHAVFQKALGAGIAVEGSTASVAVLGEDTIGLSDATTLLCDIQAVKSSGLTRTVWFGRIRVLRDITRQQQTSVPVVTTEEPLPVGPAGPNEVSTSTATDITGLLKGNGSTVEAAVEGTDYETAGAAAAAQAFAIQRANHTGTQAHTTITGLGGAATLNVGTTAGTVAAGDDSRLSDSREWTAETVSQEEAEAGTSTTRRAWTAQRVLQAIASWISGNSSFGGQGTSDNGKLAKYSTSGTLAITGDASINDLADASKNVTLRVDPGSLTAKRAQVLQDKNGTVALTSDIPTTPEDIGAQPAGDYIVEGDSRLSDARTPTAHTHTGAELDYSGTTDIGADLADADEIMVSDGGGNTTRRKSALSRFWTYVLAKIGSSSASVVTNLSTLTNTSATTINLTASDSGTILRCTASTTVTVNMPSIDPGGNFSVGFIQAGTGTVTFSANGKTMNSFNNLTSIAGRHAWASVIRVGTDTYNLSGTLS